MILGALYSRSDPQRILPRVWRTANAVERMRGLLGRPVLGPGEAFLIEPCGSIHTWGMTYALDIVFLSSGWEVKKLVRNLVPWRMASCLGAAMTLELRAGALTDLELVPGAVLEWTEGRDAD